MREWWHSGKTGFYSQVVTNFRMSIFLEKVLGLATAKLMATSNSLFKFKKKELKRNLKYLVDLLMF